MPLTLKNNNNDWLLYFEQLDSTNNYAMQCITDDMAQHGQVVIANNQTNGRGQRNKPWENTDNDLKMTLILDPAMKLEQVFSFSMLIAIAVTEVLEEILPEDAALSIKWPNDIYINDKKASGILIENAIRGTQWQWAVVGIGINRSSKINIQEMNAAGLEDWVDKKLLPTQLELVEKIRAHILNHLYLNQSHEIVLKTYHQRFFRLFQFQDFENLATFESFTAQIMGVNDVGQLILKDDSGQLTYWNHGTLKWLI